MGVGRRHRLETLTLWPTPAGEVEQRRGDFGVGKEEGPRFYQRESFLEKPRPTHRYGFPRMIIKSVLELLMEAV